MSVRLADSHIGGWSSYNGITGPNAVNVNCGHCARLVTFACQLSALDSAKRVVSLGAICPNCQKSVTIVSVDASPSQALGASYKGVIIMHPEPKWERRPIEGISAMGGDLSGAYIDAVNVFNAHVWSATVTCCRRVLEGIVGSLLPEADRKGSLANQIAALGKSTDLAKPLVTLSNAVRFTGNFGAHFDPTRIPDQEMAEAAIELTEYLLEYVYTVPGMITALETKIGKSPNANTTLMSNP